MPSLFSRRLFYTFVKQACLYSFKSHLKLVHEGSNEQLAGRQKDDNLLAEAITI